jgi:quercetin dioxygenase-like cupin family protein
MRNLSRRTRIILAIAAMTLGVGLTVAYATLPITDVDETTVGFGTLAGKTPMYVQSEDAFEKVIKKHAANSVLQHGHFAPNFSTGWHTHPGPAMVFIMSGTSTLIDEHCHETTYGPGQGFVTGLKVHEAITGPDGVDFYQLYLLPTDADVLRTDANPPVCLDK